MEAPVTGGFTKKFDIPLSHLDFEYVKKCSDVKELEKILRVLKSNEEGHFPQLEKCCEEKLTALNPSSRVLRKDKPVGSKGDLDADEREELDNDLKSWTSDMKFVESEINTVNTTPSWTENDTDLPPIRSGSITLTADGAKSTTTTTTKANKRVMPREYRDWDKIDIDKELDKIDEQGDSKKKDNKVIGNKEVNHIPDQVNVSGLTESEKIMKANREKEKGNEAFRSSDYKEAVSYYSRSIHLQPTAASYNNRALAYLKNEDWKKALADTNKVMKMEPDNVKALLRRGSAYKGLERYTDAKSDLTSVLQLEPKNKKAQDLILDIEKIILKKNEERKTKGRRMVIEDVDGDNDKDEGISVNESVKQEPVKPKPSVDTKQPRRMQIEEVESDEDEEEDKMKDSEDVKNTQLPLVNGHLSPREHKSSENKVNEINQQTVDGKESSIIENVVTDESSKPNKSNKEEILEPRTESPELISDVVNENREVSNSKPVISNETEDNGKSSVEETVTSDEHIFKRPVFYRTEFPDTCATVRWEANNCFRNGQYGEGCVKYSKLIMSLEKEPDQIVNLSLTYSNRAACHLKTGDLPSAVRDCTKSLELIPHSFKPLLRRAMAYEHLERFDKAYVDYRHILLIDGNVQQAHLGTKRCQEVLSKKDGSKWREKVKLPQLSPWEVPDIQDISEKDKPSGVDPPVSSADNTQRRTETVQEKKVEEKPKEKKVEEKPKEKKLVEKPKEKVLSTKEKFDQIKVQGNDFVKQGKFKEAVDCYTECSELFPKEAVSYTNRALCYIRLNQAEKADSDCTKVLDIEKDNVKALFRRAQARKMLKNYVDGIKDLKHLLDIEPKNGPAKKEMELMKNYWREQLQTMKKDMPTSTSGKSSAKPADGSSKLRPEKKDKTRKRMVIEEVESDEETPPSKGKDLKGKKKDEKAQSASKSKPKIEEVNKAKVEEVKLSQSVKQESKQSTNKDTKSAKASKTAAKKTAIIETSTGLPRVPKTVPKLEKATPYEFISAWNSLKKSDTVKPYYELLQQINPADIKTVISNKLDGNMLTTIVKCVSEHFLKDGHVDTSYQLLHNLSKVPRFGTVSMFMSSSDKSDVKNVMDKFTDHKSSHYTQTDVQRLRQAYSV